MGNQSGTLAAIVTDRNTWQGRANQAWGASRIWNSGTSWENSYNSEVALYNDMVNQRNTWQANANTAYQSGTWGVGSTWQSLYNAALPPAAPGDTIVGTASSTTILGTGLSTQYIVTVDRTGYWYASAFVSATGTSGNDTLSVNIFYNGVNQRGVSFSFGGTRASGGVQVSQPTLISAGQQITLQCNKTGANYTVDATLTELRATFVSTQANPH